MQFDSGLNFFRSQGMFLGEDHEVPGLEHDLLEELNDDVVGESHPFLGDAELGLHFFEHSEDVGLETV